jgi:hypothetical protein
MKLVSTAVIAFVLSSSFGAFAKGKAEHKHMISECEAPVAACKAAGFVPGAHKKGDKEGADNGLWVDCINAVADGKKQVNGVDQAAAQACKAAHKEKKHKK